MRRIVLVVLLVLSIMATSAYAGGAGNCTQPLKKTTKWLGVGAGAEYNYMDHRMNELDNDRGARGMKVEKMNAIYGKGIIGLGNYVNLYGKVGATNYDLQFRQAAQDATMKIDLKDGIYTGAGVNALFPLMDVSKEITLGLGIDVQSNFFYNDVKGITRSGENATSVGGSFYGVDGQNSLYLSCKYDVEKYKTLIIPYVGGYQSWMLVGTAKSLTYETPSAGYVKKDFQAAYDFLAFGVLVGVDVDIAQYVNLNVEGRFIGETALTAGATVKF